MKINFPILAGFFMAIMLGLISTTPAAEAPVNMLKTESFDRDPGWEAYNNRIFPTDAPTVTQDFGYSRTHFAGKSDGEIGGLIARASEPAWYAAKISPRTLDDKLSASGTFALKAGGSGICFGWFNGRQPSGMGRPMNSLGMMLSTKAAGGRLAIHLVTAKKSGLRHVCHAIRTLQNRARESGKTAHANQE